jgi:dipeptidyl aminopeptidase/acylaminoacyl peptidase
MRIDAPFMRAMQWAVPAVLVLGLQLLPRPAAAATPLEVPLEVYGRLPAMENVALSPDGTKLALVRARGDDRVLVIASLSGNRAIAALKVGQTKLRDVEWADDSHVLLLSSSTGPSGVFLGPKREYSQLQIYDLDTNRVRNPLSAIRDVATSNVIMGELMVRRSGARTYLVVPGVCVTGHKRPVLFRIDLTNGARLIEDGDEDTLEWVVDGDGKVIAAEKYRNSEKRWALLLRGDAHQAEAAYGEGAIEIPSIAGISADAASLWIRVVADDSDDPVWKSLSLKDGTWSEPREQTRGLVSLIKDRYTGRVIGGKGFSDHAEYRFFDPQVQANWDAVERKFPSQHPSMISHSDDFRRWVVLVGYADIGPAYALVDLDSDKARKIGASYDGLTNVAEVRAIAYPAADGLKIPAYLTLPAERAATNLPLIVLPHGGPAVRDHGGFDWWAQALAAQGYAVLQPNYRGSALGWNFVTAGFGQWGRKMQTDLSDGVRYLAAQGLIDPRRVCIVGASYGGYAALAGAALDPGVYRCVASIAGIADLKRFLVSVADRDDTDDSQSGRYWNRFLGVTGAADPLLDTISPLKHIDAIAVPVLLVHGKDDTVVPYEQSQIMAAALRKAGKPVEFVTLRREDHWLSRSETRLQMLQAVVKFLKINNPPD